MPEKLEELEAALVEARGTLAGIRIRGPHPFVQFAVVGYLWTGIAIGDSLVALIRGRAGGGGESLKRHLQEGFLDLLYLISDPDPDLLSAISLLSEFRGSRRLVDDYRRVMEEHPEAELPPVPEHWGPVDRPIEETIATLDADSARLDAPPDLFARAWDWWEKHPRAWHWSGLSRKKMVDVLVARGKLSGKAAFMAMSLTNIYNAGAHASPAWANLPPGDPDGPFPAPGPSSETVLAQLAVAGTQFVTGIRAEVHNYFAGLDGG
jgi:hypothetical protein